MKDAAIGFRAHSGWTALVAISLEEGCPLVLLRQRPHLVKTFTYELRQPYHTAAKGPPTEAHRIISGIRTDARRLGYEAIRTVQARLQEQDYDIKRCGLLLAAGGQQRSAAQNERE